MSPRHERVGFAGRVAGSIAFAVVCVAIFAWLFTLAGGQLPLRNAYPYGVEVVVPSAVELAQDADVREAGVKVGRITAIANRGETAVLQLAIGAAHAPIYRNAQVRVRTKTLVGENYIDLDPGTPQAGRIPNGGLLPIDHALPETQIDQILSTFDAPTRRRLQRLLDSLSQGLGGNGGENLNRLFESSSALVSESAPALDVLGAQRENVATLVDDFGQVMRAVGDRAASVRLLARQLRAEAQAVSARDQQLSATIAVLPSTLRQAQSTTTHLGGFATRATPVLAKLTSAFNRLVPAVQALGPAASATRAMLDQLGRFDRAGTPMLAALGSFSTASYPVVPELDGFLRQINPLLRYLDPYSPELGAFFGNQRSITSSTEGPGRIGRVQGIVSSSTLASSPPQLQSAVDALVRAGALEVATGRGNNAYPMPGEAAQPRPFTGSYQRLTADPPAVLPPTRSGR